MGEKTLKEKLIEARELLSDKYVELSANGKMTKLNGQRLNEILKDSKDMSSIYLERLLMDANEYFASTDYDYDKITTGLDLSIIVPTKYINEDNTLTSDAEAVSDIVYYRTTDVLMHDNRGYIDDMNIGKGLRTCGYIKYDLFKKYLNNNEFISLIPYSFNELESDIFEHKNRNYSIVMTVPKAKTKKK